MKKVYLKRKIHLHAQTHYQLSNSNSYLAQSKKLVFNLTVKVFGLIGAFALKQDILICHTIQHTLCLTCCSKSDSMSHSLDNSAN